MASLNDFGRTLVWVAIQATLFLTIATVMYFALRRRGPVVRSVVAGGALAIVLLLTLVSYSGWPAWWRLPIDLDTVAAVSGAGEGKQPKTRTVDLKSSPASATSIQPPIAKHNASIPPEQPSNAVATLPQPDLTPPEATAETTSVIPPPTMPGTVAEPKLPQTEIVSDSTEQSVTPALPVASNNQQASSTPTAGLLAHWPAIIAGLFLLLTLFAFIRLGIGLLSVLRYRRRAVPIDDAALLAEVAELTSRIGCTRPVALCESPDISTPATIGWRRPLVLLPQQWGQWSSSELRAVLAHEIAHISRGDFLWSVVAQLTTALHFYHPLVHWLSRRLQLEQELAADACSAALAGGSKAYGLTLAKLALQQDDRALAWSARPFLPSRSTFMRRIEMLRDGRGLPNVTLSPTWRRLLLGSLAAVAILIVGLRGPAAEEAAVAQAVPTEIKEQDPSKADTTKTDPAKTNQTVPAGAAKTAGAAAAAGDNKIRTESKPFELTLVPTDATEVIAARPAAILAKNPALAKAIEQLQTELPLDKLVGMPLSEIESVIFVPGRRSDETGIPDATIVIRSTKPTDWNSVLRLHGPKNPAKGEHYGFTFYYEATTTGSRRKAYWRPDDHTLVLADQATKIEVLFLHLTEKTIATWAPTFEKVGTADIAFFVDSSAILDELNWPIRRNSTSPSTGLVTLLGMLRQVSKITGAITLDDKISIRAEALCENDARAKEFADSTIAAKTLIESMLPVLRREQWQGGWDSGRDMDDVRGILFGQIDHLLTQVKPQPTGKSVSIEMSTNKSPADFVTELILPGTVKIRAALLDHQRANNMRKIIIAFHNVVDVTKRFPAASILGPDGKTPHSWRVAILRYLGDEKCNDLYKQYKFDESWDSPANMKVLEQMPDVYRDPTDDPKSTNSRYFVLTGKDLMFSAQPAKSGKIFRDITDGTSKTIFLAESKENVPWTKPEDLPVEAGKPLPKLSTTDPRYYRVGFFDGGVRKVSSEIDDATLWKMITPAGGETVDPKELDGPAKGADATVGETFHPKLDLSKLPKELAENEAVQKVVALIPMVDRGTRGDRAKHQNEVHALFAKFPEVKTLLHHVANGEVPGASDEQKFYAAMTLGEMGRPTVIGPNSVGDYLRNYIQLHTNMRLGKRLKLDPALNDLIVEVPKDKERDKAEGSPTFQELLWKIVSKYKLGYKIEDDTLVITKGTAVENASKNLAGNKPFDLTYVPSDVTAILAIRPAVILAKNPELRATLAGLKEFQTLEKEVGMPLDELESLLIFPAEQYRVPVVVLRSEKPTDWKAFLKKAGWKNPVAHEYAGETVYQVKMRRTMEGGYWIPDQHTIVITWQHAPSVPSALGISIVTAKAKLKPAWGAEFEKVATSDIAFYINGVAAANNTDQMVKSRSGSMGSIWAVLAFFRQVPTVIGAVDISDKLGLRLEAVCENDRRAKEVNESAVAIRSLVQSMLPVIRRELFPTSRQAGEELEKLKDKLFDSFGQFLARLNPQQEGSRVTIKAELQVSLSVLLKDFLLPGIAGMRKATIAAEQANRLRQIALAFHTYHDAHKQFPPAVILGPDGKTPHSWRVALLPYLEMGSLYNAYKFDQPWDSPANLELMKAVPDVFCDVTKYPKNTNSSYYVLTGKDAMFSAEAAKTGTTVRQIKDGLSNTILVVEAERDIPWTKPEDIPVEKDKPLPELRSPNPLAYRFAFADGSVQQLPSGVMEETIRKLITPAGGEVVHRESELEYVPTPKPDAPRP